MTNYVGNLDGGMTSVVGHNRRLKTIMSVDGVVVSSTDLKVAEQSSPSASVDVAVGDLFLFNSDYVLHGWSTAVNALLITSNSSGNGRIDAVVAYIDLAAYTAGSSNNPGALKFMVVAGTPDVSPVAPSDVTVQAAVGASNPYERLANIAVANGFTTIVNANITDTRGVATYAFARLASLVMTNAGTLSALDTAGTVRTLLKFNANNVLELASKTAVVNQGYLTDTGSANAYAVTATPAPLAYETGMEIIFKAANASTGTSTINVNALGTKTIKKNGSSDVATGDIIAAGIYKLLYDGTYFQFCGPVGGSGGSSGDSRRTIDLNWSNAALPDTNFAGISKTIGTNWVYKTLDFDQTTSESAYWYFRVPSDLSVITTAAVKIDWTASSGTGTFTASIVTRCPTDDEVIDATTTPSSASAVTGTDTLIATGDLHQFSVSLTTTGWAAGDLIQMKFSRDIADTLSGDAKVISVTVELR